jgi:hypothetical protein
MEREEDWAIEREEDWAIEREEDWAQSSALSLLPSLPGAGLQLTRRRRLCLIQDEKGARVRQRDAWAFSAIDRMFAAVCSSIGLVSPGFHLFGHSAGAQFVHRYLAFTSTSLGRDCAGDVEERHLLLACSANAGAYLMPSWAEDFPFGLRGDASCSCRRPRAFLVC